MKILHILRVILVAMLAVVLAGVPATAAGRRSKREQRREQSLVAELEKKGYLIPARLVKTPFDAQFNQLVLDVYHGKRGPEDVRINGASLLWYAADKGMLESVELLLEKGASTSAYRNGESLIYRAVLSGNKKLVEFLEKKCCLFLNDPRCRTAWKGACGIMKRAVQSGDRDCIEYVHSQIGSLIPRNRHDWSVIDSAGMAGKREIITRMEEKGWPFRANEILLRAATSGEVEILRYLESRGAEFNYVGTADYTPLMTAALSGDADCVRYVLDRIKDKKKEVNKVTRTGDTAIQCAAASGNVAVMNCLMQHGPDVKVESKYTGSVFENAAASGNTRMIGEVFKICSPKPEHITRGLCAAARFGHLDAVRFIAETYFAPVNSKCTMRVQHARPFEDMTGTTGVVEVEETTPLMAAIAGGNMDIFMYFVNRGAELTLSTGEDETLLTPLRAAARRGQPDMLRYIMTATCNEVRDPGALNQAAENGNLACVRLLVENGWDVNATDPETGLTALQAACCRGTEAPGSERWNYDSGTMHDACVSYLLKAGALATGQLGKKAKALALYGEVPLFECAEVLWEQGGSLSDDEMLYPLHRAAEFGFHIWVKRLIAGLNARTESDERNSPLFTVLNVADSHVPYADEPTRSDVCHGKCLKIISSAGAKLTPENKAYLKSSGGQTRPR